MSVQSGAYLKPGLFFNLRKDIEKKIFFRLGLFLTYSIVHEEGGYYTENVRYNLPSQDVGIVIPVNYTHHSVGVSGSIGYEFKLSNRIKMNIDYQLSYPLNRETTEYGFRNFIPGMGYKESKSKISPLLTCIFKYKLE